MTPARASAWRALRPAAYALGLLLASLLAFLAGRLWPDSGLVRSAGLAVLAGSLAALLVAGVQAWRARLAYREAWAALERSQAELRASLAALTPAERAELAAALPGFRQLMREDRRK